MSVNLTKGQRVDLTKDGGLSKVFMGLGWTPEKKGFFGGAGKIDLDASCILFDENKQAVDNVWFRQLRSRDGSIQHSGDNRTGEGDGDDETIHVDLAKLPANVKTLVFVVNSFTGQSFKDVKDATCRLVDQASGKELCQFVLTEKGDHKAIIMASLYRHNGGWKMAALGDIASGQTVQDVQATASRLI